MLFTSQFTRPRARSGRTALLSLLLLSLLLVSCAPDLGAEDRLETHASDLCHLQRDVTEPVKVVATTGQIGDVVHLVTGLTRIPEGMWSRADISARTGWTPPADVEADPPRRPIVPTELPVQVTTMMGPGVDPHLYLPSLKDAELLNDADIIFYNGLHLEAQMLNALHELAESRCVVSVGDRLYAQPEYEALFIHTEDGLVDPHIWNSPELWSAAVAEIASTLDQAYQGEQSGLEDNAAVLTERIRDASEVIRAMFSDERIAVRYLVTAHDAFAYFTALAGLEGIGLQGLSTETEISAFNIQSIADMMVEHQIPALFVESSVSEDAVAAVQAAVRAQGWDVALGGELYSDALGPVGTEGDTVLGMLQHNAIAVYSALASEPAGDRE